MPLPEGSYTPIITRHAALALSPTLPLAVLGNVSARISGMIARSIFTSACHANYTREQAAISRLDRNGRSNGLGGCRVIYTLRNKTIAHFADESHRASTLLASRPERSDGWELSAVRSFCALYAARRDRSIRFGRAHFSVLYSGPASPSELRVGIKSCR